MSTQPSSNFISNFKFVLKILTNITYLLALVVLLRFSTANIQASHYFPHRLRNPISQISNPANYATGKHTLPADKISLSLKKPNNPIPKPERKIVNDFQSTNQTKYQLSIPSLNLWDQPLQFSSIENRTEVQNKLNYTLVVENQLTGMPCNNSNSYIYGHSSPEKPKYKNLPGSYIFKNLGKIISGAIIDIQVADSNCQYEVFKTEIIATNNYQISQSTFEKMYYPKTPNTLTLQTCGQGDDLILVRARLIES